MLTIETNAMNMISKCATTKLFSKLQIYVLTNYHITYLLLGENMIVSNYRVFKVLISVWPPKYNKKS